MENSQFPLPRRPALTLLHEDLVEERLPSSSRAPQNSRYGYTTPQDRPMGSYESQDLRVPSVKQQEVSERASSNPYLPIDERLPSQNPTLLEPPGIHVLDPSTAKPSCQEECSKIVVKPEVDKQISREAEEEFNARLESIPLQLLFRSPLSKPPQSHCNQPWYKRQEDVSLAQLWEPHWKTSEELTKIAEVLMQLPSTTTIYQHLRKERESVWVSEPATHKSKEKDIAQMRLLLEKQNHLRDIEDMKAREEVLSNLRLSLTSRNVFRLTGVHIPQLPQETHFPDLQRRHRRTATSTYSSWCCSTFTLEDIRKAFQCFEPPLVSFPPYPKCPHTKAPQQLLFNPPLRMPTAVAEHFALVVELRIKHTLFTILAKLAASSNEHPRHITLQFIEKLLRKNMLQEFPWDTPTALLEIQRRYLYASVNQANTS